MISQNKRCQRAHLRENRDRNHWQVLCARQSRVRLLRRNDAGCNTKVLPFRKNGLFYLQKLSFSGVTCMT